MATVRVVKVKRSVFTKLTDPTNIKEYITSCVDTGSAAALYRNPKIITAFYTQGTDAVTAIDTAKATYDASPTSGNYNTYINTGTDGIAWLNSYADKVEPIANSDTNRTTREQAYANIELSYLTAQKLKGESKGTPAVPQLLGTATGGGKLEVDIVNGADYKPSQVTVIVIQSDAEATVTLIDGVLLISFAKPGTISTVSASGKGRKSRFKNMGSGISYDVYGYSQNGKKLFSDLSNKITVES